MGRDRFGFIKSLMAYEPLLTSWVGVCIIVAVTLALLALFVG